MPVLQGVKLSKTQDPTMEKIRKRMKSHSLCLSHRFYKVCYDVYQTYCVPHHEFDKEDTIVIQEWITGQRSKLSLED